MLYSAAALESVLSVERNSIHPGKNIRFIIHLIGRKDFSKLLIGKLKLAVDGVGLVGLRRVDLVEQFIPLRLHVAKRGLKVTGTPHTTGKP